MYASRAVPAIDQDGLIAILRKSKANNPQLGVTGVLCFSEGIFLQVLEGGRSAVNRLYNRIVSDSRHTEVEAKMQEVLRALVIDTDSDHNTNETAKRVAKMFLTEVFKGRYVPMPAVTEFPNASRLNELMIVGPIKVRSACSHHLCPIMGKVWVGILPNEHSNLIGLSKYARICDWIMSRPQIQEEAVTMLANELQERVKPDGLAIVMEADHFCMHWRGVKDDESMMTNSVMRGAFLKDASLRREFLSLLSKKT